jgi:hypothetical protein
MKQNFSTTLSYFISLGFALLMHPAPNFSNSCSTSDVNKSIVKETKTVAAQKSEVLHSELLFKY